MTHDEAIQSLMGTCEQLKEAIEILQEENAFLADTIEKNNLGQIVSERRALLSEVAQSKSIKREFETKMSDAESKLADAEEKQSNINEYIKSEVEKTAKTMRSEFKQRETDAAEQFQEIELSWKRKYKRLLIVTFACAILGVIGIVVNFL